jgi:hypothetical protein
MLHTFQKYRKWQKTIDPVTQNVVTNDEVIIGHNILGLSVQKGQKVFFYKIGFQGYQKM